MTSFPGAPQPSSTYQPGYVPNVAPFGMRGDTASAWVTNFATTLANNIWNQWTTTRTLAGMPASWPYGPITASDITADGVSPNMWTKLQAYAASDAAANDKDVAAFMGRPKPAARPDEWIPSPETTAAALNAQAYNLNLRQQQFAEAKFAIELAMTQTSRSSRSSSSGGGSYSPGQAFGMSEYQKESLAIERAKMALQEKVALGQLDLDKLKFAADKAYQDAQLAITREQMAESSRQFNETMAYQRDRDLRAENLQRAETISKIASDPGDAVNREFFLRMQGAEPTGTPVNIFTGQAGNTPMTLSQLMEQQAPQLRPFTNAGVTGAPPPQAPAPTPAPTPPPVPPAEMPQFAQGTDPSITPDGWTMAPKFIAGDEQTPGVPNPEVIDLRVRNGQAEAKVTPLSQIMGYHFGTHPHYGAGTVPYYASGTEERRNRIRDRSGTYSATDPATDPATGPTPTPTTTNQQTQYQKVMSQPYREVVPQWLTQQYQDMVQANSGGLYWTREGWRDPVTTEIVRPNDLTGAQIANGVTQSWNPNAPNYVPPKGMPTTPPPGVEAPPPPAPKRVFNGTSWVPQDDPSLAPNIRQPMPAPPAADPNQGGSPNTTDTLPPPAAKPAGYWGTTPLGPEWNFVSTEQPVPYSSIANPSTIWMPDGQGGWRNPRPGEVIPAGMTVHVNMSGKPGMPQGSSGNGFAGSVGDNTSPDKAGSGPSEVNPNAPPPTEQGDGTVVHQDNGVNNPIVGQVPAWNTINEGGVSLSAPNEGGFRAVITGGTFKTPDGGGTINLIGDGTEFQGPDGTFWSWNTVTNSYQPIMPVPTFIFSAKQFYALPPATQQAILSGKKTNYVLVDSTANLSPEVRELLKDNPMFQNMGRSAPWTNNLFRGRLLPNRNYTREEFLALPPDQQRALLEGRSNDPRQFVRGFDNTASTPTFSQIIGGSQGVTGFQVRPEQYQDVFNYSQYLTPELEQALYPQFFAGDTGRTTSSYAERLAQGATPPPAAPPPATPPPATPPPPTGGTGTPPPTGGTGAPPPTGGTGTPPPAGGTGTPPPSAQDQLSQLLKDLGIDTLSYGNDVYGDLPVLGYLGGTIDQGQYETLSSAPVQVPALGLTLPAPSQLPWDKISFLKDNNPSGFALLDALYKAGNVPLSSILGQIANTAPRGTAFDPTLIQV